MEVLEIAEAGIHPACQELAEMKGQLPSPGLPAHLGGPSAVGRGYFDEAVLT